MAEKAHAVFGNGSMDAERPEESDPLEELMAEVLERPVGERAEAFRMLCRDHPDQAAELEERLEALQAMGVDPLAGPRPAFPEELGDFRLIRRLGGGGMGVVYLAEQRSLGREVALKLIRPEHLFFPGAHERFRREVEAVARLQHPGIVPIYTVGEEEGLPFFAMERVHGCTLAEVLDDLSGRAPETLTGADLVRAIAVRAGVEPDSIGLEGTPFARGWVEACLDLARQVAEALDHVHARGIVHRDVKPSNVAVTPDGRAMLLDFGLTSSAGADRVTRSGSQLGTLQYMSPEQVRGDATIDGRTDVYSLGVTLYELLTLQVPHDGENRVEIQERILAGRIDSIRARNRRVSPEAETVCFAAMDLEPGRRYASGAAFARDLENALELRPIAARPPGPLLRARRWAQRNPAASVALALGFLLVVVTPSALLVQQSRHAARLQEALTRETEARGEAEEQRGIAEEEARRFEQVRDFLVDVFRVTDPELTAGETVTARDVLDQGVRRIETELADQPDTRAALMLVLGQAYRNLGLYDQARELIEPALEHVRATPDRELLADATFLLASTLRTLGEYEAAEALFLQEIELRLELGTEDEEAAQPLWSLAIIYRDQQRWDESVDHAGRALAVLRAVGAEPAEQALVLGFLAGVPLSRAQQEPGADRYALYREAETRLRETLAIYDEHPEGNQLPRAEVESTLGVTLKRQGRLAEAEPYYLSALETFREIMGEDDMRVAGALHNLASLLLDQKKFEQAIPYSERAVQVLSGLLPPDDLWVVLPRDKLGSLYFESGRHAEAEEIFLLNLPHQREVQRVVVPYTLTKLGHCAAARGDHDGAEKLFHEALEAFDTIHGEGHPDRSRTLGKLIELYELQGRTEEADEARALLPAGG